MKRTIFASVLLIVAADLALGADLPQPPPPPPPQAPAAYIPVTVPVYNWGGIYFGINGGGGWGSTDFPRSIISPSAFDVHGAVIGATVGANLQFQQFVFGIESDFDLDTLSGHASTAVCANCQLWSAWLGTLRARAGFAADRVLFYGTAGGAYGSMTPDVGGANNNSTSFGWTAGAGIEWAILDQWTVRAEYLYVYLPGGSCTVGCNSPPGTPLNVSLAQNLVRAGINFKFR